MTPTKEYAVNFYKTVTTDYGQDRKVCQGVVQVRAADERAALELAKMEFCHLRHLHHWSLHADCCDIAEGSRRADPSRG